MAALCFLLLGALLLQVGELRVHGVGALLGVLFAIVSACFDLSLLPLAPLVRFVVAGEELPEVVEDLSRVQLGELHSIILII